MTSRIPHLLEPYLTLSDETSLLLITGVLGASTNWLVLRHLHALLKPSPSSQSHPHNSLLRSAANGSTLPERGEAETEVAVLLVSFLRDFAFWKENASRLGLDLEAAARKGRFGFVDGLSSLFTPPIPTQGHGQGQQQQQLRQPQQLPGQGWKRTLTSPAPRDIARVVMDGVEQLQRSGSSISSSRTAPVEGSEIEKKKVVLVIDGLDFVLAASNPTPNPGAAGVDSSSTAMALKEMLMDLREKTHAAIITLAADDPLIKEQETTLEKQHAWLALSLAHDADTVLSLRLLDTGAAKDVSGVIRITHGDARTRDHEYLYQVGGDGGVRVFERGQ